MVPVRFTASEDQLLIRMVRDHTELWNMMDDNFKNVSHKEKMWCKIGKLVNKSGEQTKIRWKSIRDHYKRQKKLEKATGIPLGRKRATYWNNLKFLDIAEDEEASNQSLLANDSVTSYPVQTVDEMEDDDEECEVQSVSNFSPNPESPKCEEEINVHTTGQAGRFSSGQNNGRIELRDILNKLLEPEVEDEMDLFFRAMSATVKKLSPQNQTEVKLRVFNLITEIEMRQQRSGT